MLLLLLLPLPLRLLLLLLLLRLLLLLLLRLHSETWHRNPRILFPEPNDLIDWVRTTPRIAQLWRPATVKGDVGLQESGPRIAPPSI